MKLKQTITYLGTGKLHKITKIGKNTNPYNPNSDYGDKEPYRLGIFIEPPQIGKRFNLIGLPINNPKYHGISTSLVTKIIDEHTFETMNSIYKIEPYNEKE